MEIGKGGPKHLPNSKLITQNKCLPIFESFEYLKMRIAPSKYHSGIQLLLVMKKMFKCHMQIASTTVLSPQLIY